MSKRILPLLAAVVLVAALALGKSLHSNGTISGSVFLDGQPLTGADVFFVGNETTNEASRSFSRTDSAGRYQIVNALPEGEYRVVVRRLIGESQDFMLLMSHGDFSVDLTQQEARISARSETAHHESPNGDAGQADSGLPAMRQLPTIYSSPEQTVLRLKISKSGIASADLHLSTSRG